MASVSYQVSQEPLEFQFGMATFWVYPSRRYAETVFRDGTRVPSVPHENDLEYLQRARDLGYGDDIWKMSYMHELCHHLLAAMEGRTVSPTLWAVAHGSTDFLGEEAIAEEEGKVLEFQRKLNACHSSEPAPDKENP